MADAPSLQQLLTDQIKQRGDLIARNASISANTTARQAYYSTLDHNSAAGILEGQKVSQAIDQDEAEKSGNIAKIAALDSSIKGLQDAINANTAVVNATANLTPAQLTQLKLNEQNAAAAAAAAAANAKTEQEKANFAAGNTKYYIIAAVVVVVIIAVLVIFSKKDKVVNLAPAT